MPQVSVHSEIEADVSFDTERADYGVPGSPVWDDMMPETLSLESLTMFGTTYSERELRLEFGNQGAEAMMKIVFNNVDWE